MEQEKRYGRMVDSVKNGSAVPFQVEGKDYCVLKDSLQKLGEDPFITGYGFDESNNGYRFEWFIAPDFQNIEELDWFKEKHLSRVETLLYGIFLEKPIRIDFDKVWPNE